MLRSFWLVWFYVVNHQSRRLYHTLGESERPHGDPERRLAHDLKRYGIAVARLDELFPGEGMLKRLQMHTEARRDSAAAKTYKEFLRNLWDPYPEIDLKNPFVAFALDEKVLRIVNAYLDMCAHFYYLTLNVTDPIENGAVAVQSQRWHRDPEDKKMCKVFIYLTDVDEGAGPFTYVRGSQYGGPFGGLFPQSPPRGRVLSGEEIRRSVPTDAVLTCKGRAGTVIFCDTVGIHRGGYATKNQRLMFTAGYCSRASVWPLRYRLSGDLQKKFDRKELSPAARYALSYNPGGFSSFLFKKIKKNIIY